MTPEDEERVREILHDKREFLRRTTIRNHVNELQMWGEPWEEQLPLLDALDSDKTYVISAKCRQAGHTTAADLWLFHDILTSPQPKLALQIAHEDGAIIRLRDMTETAHEGLPDEIRPGLEVSNNRTTRFAHNHGGFDRIVAGGRGQGKSWSYNHVHLTEAGYYPENSPSVQADESGTAAEQAWQSALATKHDPRGKVIVESTGNGPGGLFHGLWLEALENPKWAPVFVRWADVGRYVEEVENFRQLEQDLTDYERELIRDYGLTLPQIAWRRTKLTTEKWTAAEFRRFYPLTELEPFEFVEAGWFDSDSLNRQAGLLGKLARCQDEFVRYSPAIKGAPYYGGVDTCGGVKRDSACFHILDHQGRHVARWHSNTASPPEQAYQIAKLGTEYGSPLTVVEANHFGKQVIEILERIGGVTLWKNDKGKDFSSTGSNSSDSKRAALVEAREMIRHKQTAIACSRTIAEMSTMVAKSNGKIEGRGEGKHQKKDDFAMAYALALWALRHRVQIPTARTPLEEEADRIRAVRENKWLNS